VPDGATNPYLAAAALLHACRFGVEDAMVAPAAQPVGADPVADAHVPANLSDAITAFEMDTRLIEALGAPLVEAFAMLKRAEWERYVAAVDDPTTVDVTPWELAYYTPFF
jgi:glutamine synthetase